MKVKGLSWISSEFRGKRVPERDFRGANVMSLLVPLQTQKSQGENPNLTGKGHCRSNLVSTETLCAAARRLEEFEAPEASEMSAKWPQEAVPR